MTYSAARPSTAFAIRSAVSRHLRLPQLNFVAIFTLIALLYLVGLPVAFLFYGAFVTNLGSTDFTLANFIRVFGDPGFLSLVGRTLAFAICSAALSLFLGATAALITERTASRLKGLVTTGTLLSLALPGLLVAIAWISLLAPRSGYVNVWLLQLIGLPRGTLDIYTFPGMVWVEGLNGAAFAYLLMLPVIRSMDRSLEEAAVTSGASWWRTLTRITMPLAFPAVLSLLLYRFIRGLESFEVPVLLGLPKGIDVMVSKLYGIIAMERAYGVANAYAIGLMAISVLGIYLYTRVTSDAKKYATVTGKGYRAPIVNLGRLQLVADSFLIFYVLVIVVFPLASLLWSSFVPYPMAPSAQALERLTLQNYETVFGSARTLRAFVNSFAIGTAVAVGCVLLTSMSAWVVLRTRTTGRWVLDLLTFVPLSMPGIILGIALLWIYLSLPIPVYGTLFLLIIGFTTNFLPTAMRFISPAMAQIHPELEEAATISGAGWWTTFRRILVPLLFPAGLAGGLYIFMLLFRVLSLAIIIYTPATIIVPVLIFDMWGETGGNAVHALLVLNTIVMLPFALGYYWLIRRYGLAGRAGAG